jgi:hypothetical protein
LAEAAWIAIRDPNGKPGDGQDNGWKLLAKAGRDGKPGEDGQEGRWMGDRGAT